MLPAIRSVFATHGVTDVRITAEWRDERNVAIAAIADGCTTIVCVGGDGTTGNVADVILRSGSDATLGVIPAGTGNDFAKTLGTDGASLEVVARRAVESSGTRVDVGRVEDRFFLNSCGFGFDVAVLQGLTGVAWFNGSALYLYAALRQLYRFRGVNIAIQSPAAKRERSLYMMLLIANGPYFGGAFLIAPSATVTDGELDGIAVADASAGRRLRMLGAATRGTHTSCREVTVERAPEFTLGFDDIPFYETDGEVHQASSATVTLRCVPRALRVITGDAGLMERPPAEKPALANSVNFALTQTRKE